MCEICHGVPSASDKSEAFASPRRICAWCDEPIFDDVYFLIDGEPVCSDCVDECRRCGTKQEAM